MKLEFFVALSLVLFHETTNGLKCKNERNDDVDWYIVYKIPKLELKNDPYNTGYAYVYMTSSDYDNGWQLSSMYINDPKSILGLTLNQVYNDKSNRKYSYVMYSDQPPNGEATENYGHTKGILAMDENVGFWLVHSIPKFSPPFSTGQYNYPLNGRENGQSALCISFNTASEAEKIVNQLLHNQPKIYDHFVLPAIEKTVSNFKELLENAWVKLYKSEALIYSTSGYQFISFAKGAKVLEDLYDNFVAPSLESHLYVETWRRGAGTPLKSECDLRYHVMNVKEVSIKGVSWQYLEDHSKWAITESVDLRINKGYTCIGDINRMKSQFKRGGGTVCFNEVTVWKTFKDSVMQIEPCPMQIDSKNSSNTNSFKQFLTEALMFISDVLIQVITELLL